MAQEIINIGALANDGTGDTIRNAGRKINANFSEFFALPVVASDIRFEQNNIVSKSSNADIVLKPSGTGNIVFPALTIENNNIKLTRSNDDLKISANGAGKVVIDGVGFSGTSIVAVDSSKININENLVLDGSLNAGAPTLSGAVTMNSTLGVTGASTLSTLTVSGASSFVGTTTVDNLLFNDNIISTSSNADLNLSPGGTGVVNVSNLTIDSSINLTDNVIKVERSNDDFVLSGNGTGSVQVSKIDMNRGTVDNVVIGGTTPAAGTFTSIAFTDSTITADGVTITDNVIKANRSNDNIEFNASGSGYVNIDGLLNFPNSDGSTGQLLQTNGSGQLAWETAPLLLGQSDIQDARNTIGFSSITEIDANTAVGAHENIGAGSDSVLDEFDQTKYDSAWYLCLQRYDSADSTIAFAGFKTTIGQGTADGSTFDGFDGTSQIVKTNNNDEIIATSSDVRSAVSKVRFKGQAGTLADGSTKSTFNALTFYRIGLGDNDSSGYTDGNVATKVTADLDSATATLDSFAHASFRGAKYYASVNNTTTNEVMNAEFIVVHNGTDAFITTYNQFTTNSGNTPLATFTADISGSDVRVRGANGTAGTCRVTLYRVLLADNESDSTINSNESIIGAQTVSNTASTTIDTNSFRGSASPDMSSQKVINSFAKTDFDSVFYHMVQKDMTNNEFIMNKLSVNHGISTDGSSVDAGVSDSHLVKSGAMNDISAFDTGINGSNVELKATGQSDGSTVVANSLKYYAIGLGPNTSTGTTGKIGTHAGVTFGGNSETRVDTLTATGTTTSILSTQRTLAEFDKTAYDSAWYLGVSNDLENSGLATFKYSVMHGTTNDGSSQDAFITSSSITRTDLSHNHLETDVDISGSNIRLLGNGGRLDDSSKSNSNTMAYYRIGLGDNDSSGYTSDDGNADTDVVTVGGIQETTIDHVTASGNHATLSATGTTTCAEFTAGQYDGALFFVVNKDVANGSFETQKISLCHNLQDSFLTSSSVVSTDEGDQHPVYTTDVVSSGDSTSKVRLRSTDSDGSTVTASNTMAYYRIGLGDNDSTGYIGELGLQNDIMHVDIIDSTVTTLDAIAHGSHVGAKYFITVNNQSTGEVGNIEALVTHDGTNAYITTYNEFFTGNNSLITLTADINGTSFRLRGSATAGSGTKVIVNRLIAFGDSESAETNADSTRKIVGNTIVSSAATTFDTFMSTETDAAHYVITGQKGSDENFICEAVVVTDGTNVFVSQGPNVSTKSTDMLVITATISSGTVSVKASSTSGASTVQAYAVKLKAPASSTATIDSFAASSFRGAKYFISLNNLDSNEVSNVECLVVHDGTNAFINQYNEHFSGSASLISGDLTADISGGQVRLRCVVAQDNTRITFYRIILSDAETDITGGTNVNVIGDVTVSSSATAIDTFVDTDIDGAHYVIIGYNSSEGAASIQEANVITNGTGAFVSSGPYVSTKGTNQLDLTAAHDGSSTVTLSASSTSGGSTKVNAYRIHMKTPVGQTDNLDSWAHASFRGAKYYISAKETNTGFVHNVECLAVHDGTDAYITAFNEHFSHVSLITLSADLSGGNFRLRCSGNIPDVKVKFYRIRLADSETSAEGADSKLCDTATVSSSATAIDSFIDSSQTGAHYVIVARNNSEGTSEITEATVVTNGTQAFVAQANFVSSKSTPMLSLTAAHDGSNTVTLSAASTAGGSTTVNAFRIHIKVEDAFSYDVIDSFAHGSHQLANYVVVGKNATNQSQIAELVLVTDTSASYLLQDGANISTHSATTPLMNFTTGHNGSNVELRAQNNQENTDTTVNMYRIRLARAAGAPSSIATLDTFDKSLFRSASYNVSISDPSSGALGLYETLDVNLTHDGTNVFLSSYGRTTNHTEDLVAFSADISGSDVRLRGTISNTNTHTVTVVRRLMKV